MVIGEKFAWGHLPKTGGDATLAMFRLFPELIVRADNSDHHGKHDGFPARASEIGNKMLVLNIRRLPSWTLSHAIHISLWGGYPDYKPLPMWTADDMAERPMGDAYLEKFLANDRFKVQRWLRTEYLRDDFLQFVSEFTDVPMSKRRKVMEAPLVNVNHYKRDINEWLRPEHIQRMYKNNPKWAKIEEQAYGDLMNLAA